VAGAVLRIMAPDMTGLIEPAYLLPVVAELAFCLWLLSARATRGVAPRSS
jgi:hypothetical protein